MNANKALWEKGDFTQLAATMRESGAALVDRIGIKKGMDVLDLGCGDGTTAIPAAMLGANVRGVDIASNLVNAGNRRAKEAGLANCTFEEGDACELVNLKDNSFDVVVSVFGAMFAPRPFDAAKEMVRVARPGGKIVMGNWIPGNPTLASEIFRVSSGYTPPPPEGFISPMLWGIEENVAERFVAAGIPKEDISFTTDTFIFRAPFPPSDFAALFKNYFGPTMNAFEAAEKDGRADQLESELKDLVAAHNKSGDPDRTEIAATFLRVTVQVPK